MFRTLRGRLIFSHVLPLLVPIPIIGIVLITVPQEQVLLSNLVQDSTKPPS